MIDQLSVDEVSYIENTYGPIEFNPDYQPRQGWEELVGITLFTGNRVAQGYPSTTTGKFMLINVKDFS